MKLCDLSLGSARLRDATDQMLLRWRDTQDVWRDANSRNITEQHLQPLLDEMKAALQAMSHLSDILQQAERDCAPWD